MPPPIQPDAHVRILRPGLDYVSGPCVASCSCGWGGREYRTKRDAASAWGMHAAAVRRKAG